MLARLFALLAPLVLTGCLLTPGKFVSSLRIDADRHFTFTYVGEVYAVDPSESLGKGLGTPSGDTPDSEDETPGKHPAAFDKPAKDTPDTEAKRRAIAAALMKEAGFRKAEYLGEGKYAVDYAVSGMLDHTFVWPFNIDAEVVFPFLAIEPRANGTVRVKAPAFGNESRPGSSMPGTDKTTAKLDGVFTLDTDAEIVSQNNEDGVKAVAGGRKTVTWRATPTTKDAPVAVLRLK